MRRPASTLLAIFAAFVFLGEVRAARVVSAAAAKPTDKWIDYPTRLLADLPGFQPDETEELSPYGGLKAQPQRATGFFRTEKLGARWWLIDPEGCRYINMAVVNVSYPRKTAGAPLKEMTPEKWIGSTLDLLRELGFNGAGAWSSTELLSAAPHRVAYTLIWNFMSAYGHQRGGIYQQSGHMGYPHDCIFVFDPEFESFCDRYARQLAETKDDPWLLGHFSDNELPFYRRSLDNFLGLPADDPGKKAADRWLSEWRKRNPQQKEITDAARDEFVGFVAERYLALTTAAIRRYDPNHLCLGPRFDNQALKSKGIFIAAGHHLDVVAVNYYRVWQPDPAVTEEWVKLANKPYLVTEWYAKGMDSGLPNTSGAGWVVKTQRDRGYFYQNFTLGCLESRGCVGWHWFKYRDNDPSDKSVDPSNTDSNKGLVNLQLQPYRPLADAMREINTQAYAIVRYFDGRQAKSPERSER